MFFTINDVVGEVAFLTQPLPDSTKKKKKKG